VLAHLEVLILNISIVAYTGVWYYYISNNGFLDLPFFPNHRGVLLVCLLVPWLAHEVVSVSRVSLVTGLVVMIIGNNIVATPLAITMVALPW